MMMDTIQGLYAVTPDTGDTQALTAQVDAAIRGGVRVVQYRNKTASPRLRQTQATALQALCEAHGAALIINDHVKLAREVGAAGVHVGAEDAKLRDARAALGPGKLIGVSCYNRLELAREAQSDGADYIAFGSFFPSQVKPGAVRATPELLVEAKGGIRVPIVAIGGITLENAPRLIAAGADAVAVISALFGAQDVTETARRFTATFESRS